MEENEDSAALDRLLIEKLKTVPHLEGLLLLWATRPKPWSAQELAARLYVGNEAGNRILLDLASEDLVVDAGGVPKQYRSNPAFEALLSKLDEAYRSDLIGISNLIHAKSESAVREFARAFRFKKERE